MGDSVGNDNPTGNSYPSRRTLPPWLADVLLAAHLQSGRSYRAAAKTIGIDVGHWWRITRGDRCPSREVAERIVAAVDLPVIVVDDLMDVAVDG